jgi:NAD-dependent dihydropyrimidine dehydrogenase PreA subunit
MSSELEFFHAFRIHPDRCRGHSRCLRICPTEALRLRKGKIALIGERCIDCGVCLNSCHEGVFTPVCDSLEDLGRFKYKVAIPSAVFYSQFGTMVHPSSVRKAILKAGFDLTVDTFYHSKALGIVFRKYIQDHTKIRPLISTHCPVVVRLLQVKYPNLLENLMPLDIPREVTAKDIRQTLPEKLGLKPEEIGIFYIAACPSIVVSVKQPAESGKSWFDGVLSLKNVYNAILPDVLAEEKAAEAGVPKDSFFFGMGWSWMGQISQAVGAEKCLSVAGLDHVMKIFDDIENSKLRHIDFLEALACMQGCVGGAFAVENPYVARSNIIHLQQAYGQDREVDAEEIMKRYREGFYFQDLPVKPRVTRFFDTDIPTSIKRMKQKERVFAKLPQKDCGLCGAPTCDAFARDCALGETDLTDCIFFSEEAKP